MKISIIVPVYNVEAYIEDCLRSVAAQIYNGELECIIVNDCTTDNSCGIIERFIAKYNGNIQFTLLHHDKNRGLSAARNTGIDAATGEYIYFLDSDDEITPNCIELLAEPLKEKKFDFVIGNYKIIGPDIDIPPLLLENGTILEGDEIRKGFFSYKWYVMAWNKLCNINFIHKNKLYFKEGVITEDELWCFQLACTAQSMYVIKQETYKYKIRETSIMGMLNAEKKANAISLITLEIKEWAAMKGILYDKDVFKKILSFREAVLGIILSHEPRSKRNSLYLECHKRIRISPCKAYKHRVIKGKSLIKEFYNYLPGILGYWYILAYNTFLKR